MIFITVGSRSFQFDRLLKAVDLAVENCEISDEIFGQIGSSTYKVKNYQTVDFLDRKEFNQKLNDCDIVLTHGGTGVIVNALKMGKRVVAVPRLAMYHEVVDDHQFQLVKAFEKLGMVTGCYDCDRIGEAIVAAKQKEIKPYESNTQVIIDSIEDLITSENGNEERKNDRQIRILMCGSDRKEKGGMNSAIDQLMDHNWGENYRFLYLATHVTGNRVKKIFFFIRAYIKLHKLIKEDFFDIIHIHMSYKGSFYRKYYVAKLCKKYDKKIIIHLHGSEFKDFYNRGNKKRKARIKKMFSSANITIVLGKYWEKFICSIAPEANVVVINNAVVIPDVPEKSVKDKRVLLFLGALIQRKGVMDLLKAAKSIRNDGIDNFKLLIAGAGEEEKKLKEYVKENNMSDIVNFIGWITKEQKPKLLENSDVLILPSYNEGLPIAILEAMSYGLPIISTAVGSIAEAVSGNGFLIKPGDVDALTDRLKTIICRDELFIEQSRKSRQIAKERFAESIFFRKIEDIYIKLGE